MIVAMRIGTSLLLGLFVHAGVAQQPALDEAAAREAVVASPFRAARRAGEDVSSRVKVRVHFELD